MEVFISWSGARSERIAEALRDWLPNVIQSVEPFMSITDIEKSSRWSLDIAQHLEQAQCGLICLTRENLAAPWLLFEAGALSKSIENSRVIPYLYGVSTADLQGPLTQFQAAFATKDSTLDVLKIINRAYGENSLEPARLEHSFETWWPQLEEELSKIPESTDQAPPSRTKRDILEEILSLCRQMAIRRPRRFETDSNILENILPVHDPNPRLYAYPGRPRPAFSPERVGDIMHIVEEALNRQSSSEESEGQSSSETDKET